MYANTLFWYGVNVDFSATKQQTMHSMITPTYPLFNITGGKNTNKITSIDGKI